MVGRREATSLLDSGCFDAAWYQARSGARFADELQAARHYLKVGMLELVSPHPLISVEELPEPVRAAMVFGQCDAFLDHLGTIGPWEASSKVATRITEQMRKLRETAERLGPRESETWDPAPEQLWRQQTRGWPSQEPRPLVSVVMPVRDGAEYLERAVSSVRAQTWQVWELLIVDDGSTDDSWELSQRLAQGDDRIQVLASAGSGVAAGRNTGIRAASGSYLAFLDCDNQWDPEFLELMLSAARSDGAWGYSALVLDRGGKLGYLGYEGGWESLLIKNHIDLNTVVVPTELITRVGGFDENLKRWVDHDLALRLARAASPRLRPFLGCRYDADPGRRDRITNTESEHWQWVVLGKALTYWRQNDERVPGRVSVVIPTHQDWRMTVAAVESILEGAELVDVEVVVVDNGSQPEIAHELMLRLLPLAQVEYLRLAKNYGFAVASNVGAGASTGEYVLFLNNDTTLRQGELANLVAVLADPEVLGAQPLLVGPEDLIQSAGVVWLARDTPPADFLVDHPARDAAEATGLELPAITGAAMLLRAVDLTALGGFDPIFHNGMEDVDLCLRLAKLRPGSFRLVPEVSITHLGSRTPGRFDSASENRRLFVERWRGQMPETSKPCYLACGFQLERLDLLWLNQHTPIPRPVTSRVDRSRLRWGLCNPAPAGLIGDRWGDTHYVTALAAALRDLGQDAVEHRQPAWSGPMTGLDEVRLGLRGRYRVPPQPGAVNVLWIISHPDEVTADELSGFDLVYAASVTWAKQATQRFGVTVRPLLQAADTRRFNLPEAEPNPQVDLVFVGGVHAGRSRPAVAAALEGSASAKVIGPGWDSGIGDAFAGSYVPNEELARTYRQARFVLTDHWPDMAAAGFIQNRVFDAVAAGVPVISDPVCGMGELFGPMVRHWRDAKTLEEAVLEGPPGWQLRTEVAKRIIGEHGFDSRAKQLITDVRELLALRSE